MAGVDHCGKTFYKTIHSHLLERPQESSASVEGRYILQYTENVCEHFKDIFADVSKFVKKLCLARACELTGMTDDQMLSIAVAIHVEKCKAMSYEEENFWRFN